MTCYEATRQYQAALEAQRRLLDFGETSVSFSAERENASAEVEQAHAAMFDAWIRNTER